MPTSLYAYPDLDPDALSSVAAALLDRVRRTPSLPCPDRLEIGPCDGRCPVLRFETAGTASANIIAAQAWSGNSRPALVQSAIAPAVRHLFPFGQFTASALVGEHEGEWPPRPPLAADPMFTALCAVADLLTEYRALPRPGYVWIESHAVHLPAGYEAIVCLGFPGAFAHPTGRSSAEVGTWIQAAQDNTLGRFATDPRDHGATTTTRLYQPTPDTPAHPAVR